ncbi:MAG: gamma-glutamyltranspeptidase/glutathione hydrolase [Myxococcota bacterium]|jgi:gamma-glutamyltranspeptidase/glutathione hydrolase
MIQVAILCIASLASQQYGAVSTTERHATQVGLDILAQGGNAIDAAVAVHFALAVTYPNAGNIGGGGFLLYHSPEGSDSFLDFREVAPAAATADMYRDLPQSSTLGWRAVGVPGAVPGMWEAHSKYGKLAWSALITPAYTLAKDGFELPQSLCDRLLRYKDTLSLDPGSKITFFGSQKMQGGNIFRQPELAHSLELISKDGHSAMRSGHIVDEILRLSAANGILTAEDFENYQPVWRPVHRFAWRDTEIVCASLPSSGGIFLQQSLSLLEGAPLAVWGFDSPRTIQLIGEATAAAFRDRNRYFGDPKNLKTDISKLLSPEYLAQRRQQISSTSKSKAHLGNAAMTVESTETTHFSIIDKWGGAVSCTTTLNGNFGAKVMAAGILFNNEMDDFAAQPGKANQFGLVQSAANAIVPGHRPLSSMAPTIVLKDGKVDAIIGSPGGPTILTTVLQVILNRYVFNMSPAAAVSAPRFHRQDLPDYIKYESRRISIANINQLRQFHQPLKRVSSLGLVDAIFNYKQQWHAISDSRGGGWAQSMIVD